MRNLILKTILLSTVILVAPAQADKARSSLRFVILGDTQGISEEMPLNDLAIGKCIARILELDPPAQFLIMLGDLVWGTRNDDLMREQFATWIDLFSPVYQSDMWGLKVYPVPGNHDMHRPNGMEIWQEAFSYLPDNGPDYDKKGTYSFDVGPCHLVAVNLNNPDRRPQAVLDWLAQDLAESDKPIKLVFAHQPAYPIRNHIGSSLDKYPETRDQFWQILIDYDVQAYFCGHEHLYNHSIHDGVHQIISGAGGAPMIPLMSGSFVHYVVLDVTDTDDLNVQVIDLDGRVREQFKLSDTEVQEGDLRADVSDMLLSVLPCSALMILPALCLSCLALQQLTRRESPSPDNLHP